MAREFPHLNDTAFPHLGNINVYQYQNNFDYTRWTDNAYIKLLAVPWDSHYVNVCEWESDTIRDRWFDNAHGYKLNEPTMFQVQPDGTVKIPVPFNAATQYNYILLEYPVMPTASYPLDYAAPARTRYYYFCNAIEELSPSTTLCRVELDTWTTYINSVKVSGMMLARGHAPMAATNAQTYLKNPRANCKYLETPDVSYGGFERSKSAGNVIYNSDVWAVVSMTADPRSSAWGTKAANTWQTPADAFCGSSSPRAHAIAVEASALENLIDAITSVSPQAVQTIKAVWFAPKNLVTLSDAFTFAGVSVREVNLKGAVSNTLTTLTPALFGYDSKYANMAKLYTYPYARIMVCDQTGNPVEIRIEETEGCIGTVAALDYVAPFINITTQISGIAGANTTVNFANMSGHTATLAGRAYDTLRVWNVPTFEVYLSAAKQNDYATHFDRAQANTALQNAYTSAVASNTTANTNALASNSTAYSNAVSNAEAAKANSLDAAQASLIASEATSNTSYASVGSANVYASDMFYHTARTQAASLANSIASSNMSVSKEIETNQLSLAQTAMSNVATPMITGAAVGGVAGAVAGGVGGVGSVVLAGLSMSALATKDSNYAQQNALNQAANLSYMYGGGFGDVISDSFQAILDSYSGGDVGSEVGAAALAGRKQNSDQNTLSRNLNQANRLNSYNLVTGGSGYTTGEDGDVATSGSYTGTANRSYDNSVSTSSATKSTADANANRSLSTANANAERSRQTALSAISNSISQAALGAPLVGGALSNAGQSDTMPLGWFAWVETQGLGAIEAAAAQFARYGYQLNQAWAFARWQVMANFTYWQCDDVWIVPTACPQSAATLIRSILIEGTTVWASPDIIGTANVWEN